MGPCITKALHLTQDVLLLYGDRVTFHARHGTVDTVDAAWMVVESGKWHSSAWWLNSDVIQCGG